MNSTPKYGFPTDNTPVFNEAICILNGQPLHLDEHRNRVAMSLHYCGSHFAADAVLQQALQHIPVSAAGRWKLRFEYSASGLLHCTAEQYQVRTIQQLIACELPQDVPRELIYPLKFNLRPIIDSCRQHLEATEEALMLYNGCVTDAGFASVALQRDGHWFTPDTPLLPGSTRTRLLREGTLRSARIDRATIGEYRWISLFNAMLPLGELKLPVTAIRL